MPGFLRQAVRLRKNIIVSGGTSTGKTTFLNALVKEIPLGERLIMIEDTPEIRLEHPNAVGLVAARGTLGEARVNVEDLLQASLRMRPDRILLGELRGPEAYSFLRAVNSGHPGSITTVHADSPRAAVDQIALMVMQAGANLSRAGDRRLRRRRGRRGGAAVAARRQADCLRSGVQPEAGGRLTRRLGAPGSTPPPPPAAGPSPPWPWRTA